MKDENEKIELLLARNAVEQLRNVDWDKLNKAISNRLDKAQQSKISMIRLPTVFKIAAGIATAAAIVLLAIVIKEEKPQVLRLSDNGNAMVEFVNNKGSASVVLMEPSNKAHVKVDIAGQGESAANCYVQIIDSSRGLKEKEDDIRPSWFIICMSEPINVNNGINRDAMDIIYLF